eukprot:1957024-Pleurochrysis_carterae.AAC.1
MVVLGLREAIFQQLLGGLLVPLPSCSGVTANLDNHLAPIRAKLAAPQACGRTRSGRSASRPAGKPE